MLTLSAVLPGLALGALTWDSRRIELTTKPGDKNAVGVFHFVNSGTATVTITSVVPGCGCTTAELAKRVYAPGEAGEIKAVLTLGDRTGVQEKTVQVTTADAPVTPTVLALHVTIPELLDHSSHLLLWRTAETLTEKSVIITNTSPKKIVTIEPYPAIPMIAAARIEVIEPGAKYRIAILPASIAQPTSQSLPFLTRFADNSTQQFSVLIAVK